MDSHTAILTKALRELDGFAGHGARFPLYYAYINSDNPLHLIWWQQEGITHRHHDEEQTIWLDRVALLSQMRTFTIGAIISQYYSNTRHSHHRQKVAEDRSDRKSDTRHIDMADKPHFFFPLWSRFCCRLYVLYGAGSWYGSIHDCFASYRCTMDLQNDYTIGGPFHRSPIYTPMSEIYAHISYFNDPSYF